MFGLNIGGRILERRPAIGNSQCIRADRVAAVSLKARAVAYFERSLEDAGVSHVLCVVDATRLEKSLYFTLQVIRESARHGKPLFGGIGAFLVFVPQVVILTLVIGLLEDSGYMARGIDSPRKRLLT